MLSCMFQEQLFSQVFSLSAILHQGSVLHYKRDDSPCRLVLTCTQDMWKHTGFAGCLWLPKPPDSLWCADSGLTQRKNAMYWITSATCCSTWEFLWESPNWYYQAFKLSLETEYNMEWLKANSEILKGFWQTWESREANKKFTHCWPKPKSICCVPEDDTSKLSRKQLQLLRWDSEHAELPN